MCSIGFPACMTVDLSLAAGPSVGVVAGSWLHVGGSVADNVHICRKPRDRSGSQGSYSL